MEKITLKEIIDRAKVEAEMYPYDEKTVLQCFELRDYLKSIGYNVLDSKIIFDKDEMTLEAVILLPAKVKEMVFNVTIGNNIEHPN